MTTAEFPVETTACDIEEIRKKLSEEYNGPLLDGHYGKYIPWYRQHEKAQDVFGFENIDIHVNKLDLLKVGETSGFLATVSIQVHAGNKDVTRDGVGWGEIRKTGNGADLIETAAKGAVSDAIGKIYLLFGRVFGLTSLHEREEKKQQGSGRQEQTTRQQQTTSDRPVLSEGQIKVLTNTRNKFTPAEIQFILNTFTWQQAKELCSAVMTDHKSHDEVIEDFGIDVQDDEKDYPF
jgi:hypothetical protein